MTTQISNYGEEGVSALVLLGNYIQGRSFFNLL